MKKGLCFLVIVAVWCACFAGFGVSASAMQAGNEPTVAYGASWFLIVDDEIQGTYTVPGAGSLPVTMDMFILMSNMDPASLVGEGEYSGLYYTGTRADWSQMKWQMPVTTTGFGDNRGYAGARFTFKETGATLEGRLFVDLTFLIEGSVTMEGGTAAGQTQTAIQKTHVLKTLPAAIGSVGQDVTVDLGDGASRVFGDQKIMGKLYSSAEMDQQTYDMIMKGLQNALDSAMNTQQPHARAAENIQETIDTYSEHIKSLEESAEKCKDSNPEEWARLKGQAEALREASARLERELATLQGKK